MKKTVIYLMIISIILILPSTILAFGGINDPNPKPLEGTDNMVGKILGVIQWIGYAIALGMLIYIGIKYTMSAANEKAELKRASVNFIIGAIIIAGAATICGWITTFFEDVDNGGGQAGGTISSGASGQGGSIGIGQGNAWDQNVTQTTYD